MWLDSAHVPHQVSYKLANPLFGPYPVLVVHPGDSTVRLALPDTLGKTSDVINLQKLKFFEQRDADLGVDDSPLKPLINPIGVEHYEISRILGHCVLNSRHEYWVELSGYESNVVFGAQVVAQSVDQGPSVIVTTSKFAILVGDTQAAAFRFSDCISRA